MIKMLNINYIVDKKTLNLITKNNFWVDSYIPEVVKRLKSHDINIVFDKKKDFDILHIHLPLSFAYDVIKNRDSPIIFHGHMTEDTFIAGKYIKHLIRKWLKNIASKSDLIICPSNSAKKYYKQLLPNHKIEQLNDGINLSKYKYSKEAGNKFRKKFKIKKNEKVVCCIGGISYRKGIEDFISLAKRFPEIKFIWIGGEYTTNKIIIQLCEVFARRSNVHIKNMPKNLLMTGYIKDIRTGLSASDIFFFPSKQETQGLALVEAAANSRPIITRDLPVFKEWLTHNHDCLMGKNIDDFYVHIKKLTNDPVLAEKLGARALKSAKKHHDIDITSKKLAKIYKEIITDISVKKTTI